MQPNTHSPMCIVMSISLFCAMRAIWLHKQGAAHLSAGVQHTAQQCHAEHRRVQCPIAMQRHVKPFTAALKEAGRAAPVGRKVALS